MSCATKGAVPRDWKKKAGTRRRLEVAAPRVPWTLITAIRFKSGLSSPQKVIDVGLGALGHDGLKRMIELLLDFIQIVFESVLTPA